MTVRLLVSTAIATIVLAVSASAADLVRAPAPVPTLAPSAIDYWSGLYVGGHAGVGGGTLDYPIGVSAEGTSVASGKASLDGSGWVAGGQIGYNWLMSNRILLGLEADIAWSDIENRAKLEAGIAGDIGGFAGSASGSVRAGSKLDYLGTVRARLGYAVTDPWLVYITGGWAYGGLKSAYGVDYAYAIDGLGAGGDSLSGGKSGFMNGWVLGVGTEYAITRNFSVRAEYMHVDLGSKTLYAYDGGAITGRLKVEPAYDIVRVGFNYRFDATGPVSAGLAPAPFVAPRSFAWTGFHIGVNAGYAGARDKYPFNASYDDGDDVAALAGSGRMKGGGALAGAQIGYDYQIGRMVLGLEADIAWADVDGKLGLKASFLGAPVVDASLGTSLTYLGTVRARLGYAVTDPWLVYATAGWAYGQTDSSIRLGTLGFSDSKKLNFSGWTAGVGTEFAVTSNLTLRAEYLHVDLGSKTLWSDSFAIGDGDLVAGVKIKPTYDLVRVGASYKF